MTEAEKKILEELKAIRAELREMMQLIRAVRADQ